MIYDIATEAALLMLRWTWRRRSVLFAMSREVNKHGLSFWHHLVGSMGTGSHLFVSIMDVQRLHDTPLLWIILIVILTQSQNPVLRCWFIFHDGSSSLGRNWKWTGRIGIKQIGFDVSSCYISGGWRGDLSSVICHLHILKRYPWMRFELLSYGYRWENGTSQVWLLLPLPPVGTVLWQMWQWSLWR